MKCFYLPTRSHSLVPVYAAESTGPASPTCLFVVYISP